MRYLLLVILVFVNAIPAFATTTTLDPIADSGIDENMPTDNYGSLFFVFWGYFSLGAVRGPIAWNLTGLTGEIVSAAETTFTLQNNYEGGSAQMQARKLQATWDEMSITWINQPDHDTTGAGLMLDQPWISGMGTHTLSLTAEALPIIQDWIDNPGSNFGLILLKNPESGDYPRCYPYSKEEPGERGVQLTVEHTTDIGIEASSLGSIKAVFK